MTTKKWIKRGLLGLAALFVFAQLVPYGHDHTNPAVLAEPAWSTPEVRALAARACFDCHSNHTRWPWYAQVAPASWLLASDVAEGRKLFNVSEWSRPQPEAKEAWEEVSQAEMPPLLYQALHPEARLTSAERQVLIDGLIATFGKKEEGKKGEEVSARE